MVEDNETKPRRRGSRPIWRRGWFWVGVIAVEIVVALVLSVAFERSTTEVDVSGGDLAAFCEQARGLRDSRAAGTSGGQVGDPTVFEREREAYLALVATAPPALVADLEKLAEVDEHLIEAVREIGAQKASDPTYNGLGDLGTAIERAGAEGRVAAARVNLVLREHCGFDPGSAVTTTTPTTTVEAPDTAR